MSSLKHFSLCLFLLFYSINASSQNLPPSKTYYTKVQNGQEVSTGVVKERWHENGDGQKNGKYMKYYSDGTIAVSGNYLNGQPHGVWKYFEGNDNRLTKIENYKNGALNGTQLKYSCFFSSNCSFEVLEVSQTEMIGVTYKVNDNFNFTYEDYKGKLSGLKIIDKGKYTLSGHKTGTWLEDEGCTGAYVNGRRHGEWKDTKPGSWDTDHNVDASGVEYAKGFKTVYDNGNVVSILNPEGVDIIAKQNKAEEQSQNFENEREYLLEKIRNEDLEAFRTLATKYPYFKISDRDDYPTTSDVLSKIEIFNSGNFTGEEQIHLVQDYRFLINSILKKEYSGIFFTNYFKSNTNADEFTIKFKKVNGKFTEIKVLSWGDNLVWGLFYNANHIPQFQINISDRNTQLGFLYKNGIKPENGCYIENSEQDFINGLNELLKEGKRDLAFEFCLLTMFYDDKVLGRMDGYTTSKWTAYLALEQNNNTALELALDRLSASCKYNLLLGCLYRGLILWKLQRYDEAIACFQENKNKKFSVGNYGETSPFLSEVLNEIKSLKERNIIFVDEKELRKRIKELE